MSTTEPLRMRIDMDRGSAPVTGSVTADRGSERAFAGWTELFAALQAVIADDNNNSTGSSCPGSPTPVSRR
jgi:hypothetical protein